MQEQFKAEVMATNNDASDEENTDPQVPQDGVPKSMEDIFRVSQQNKKKRQRSIKQKDLKKSQISDQLKDILPQGPKRQNLADKLRDVGWEERPTSQKW